MTAQPCTVFAYLYRDAANYKAFGQLLLRGGYTSDDEETIRKHCDWGNHFVAEQVGVPTLYAELYQYSNGPTADDIAFHEFEQLRHATPEELASLKPRGTLSELVTRFQAVDLWDCRLSPHCE